MKTIEEKAKAYDEAYKVAVELHNLCKEGTQTAFHRANLETMFPELAESEGEKVRKELIKHLKELSDWKEDEVIPVKNPSYYRQWASWLENVPVTIDNEKREGFHLGYKACLERQGEQEKDILEDAILDGDEDGLIAEIIRYKKEKQGEKKPADSYCQENCKGFQETGKCFADGECKAKKEAKQKPVWSEEDSFRTETLISVIKSGGSIRPELRNEYVNWLKSLRPQSRWKPTELQLGCLSDAIEHYNSLGYPASKLKELYEQLKKL